MWKWLDVGVERVQQHFSNLNVDSNAMTNEKKIHEKEDNRTVEILINRNKEMHMPFKDLKINVQLL